MDNELGLEEIKGKIGPDGVFNIIEDIYKTKRTGYIIFREAQVGEEMWLFFDRGDIIAVSSHMEDAKLGQLAIKKGYLSKEDLDRALIKQTSEGGILGEILSYMGFIEGAKLEELLREQFLEILLRIFSKREGEFIFYPQTVVFADNIQPLFTTPELIHAGKEFFKNLIWLSAFNYDRILVLPMKKDGITHPSLFGDYSQKMLSLVGEGKFLEEMIEESPLQRFLTINSLFELKDCGMIKFEYRGRSPSIEEGVGDDESKEEDDITLASQEIEPSVQKEKENEEGKEKEGISDRIYEEEEDVDVGENGTYITPRETLDKVDLSSFDFIEPVSDVFVDEVIEAFEGEDDKTSSQLEDERGDSEEKSAEKAEGFSATSEEEAAEDSTESGSQSSEGTSFTPSYEQSFDKKSLTILDKKIEVFNSIFSIIFSTFSSSVEKEKVVKIFDSSLSNIRKRAPELFTGVEVMEDGSIQKENLLLNLSKIAPENPSEYLHNLLSDLFSYLIYDARKILPLDKENEMIEKILTIQHKLYFE